MKRHKLNLWRIVVIIHFKKNKNFKLTFNVDKQNNLICVSLNIYTIYLEYDLFLKSLQEVYKAYNKALDEKQSIALQNIKSVCLEPVYEDKAEFIVCKYLKIYCSTHYEEYPVIKFWLEFKKTDINTSALFHKNLRYCQLDFVEIETLLEKFK